MKRLFCLKTKTTWVASLPRPCLIIISSRHMLRFGNSSTAEKYTVKKADRCGHTPVTCAICQPVNLTTTTAQSSPKQVPVQAGQGDNDDTDTPEYTKSTHSIHIDTAVLDHGVVVAHTWYQADNEYKLDLQNNKYKLDSSTQSKLSLIHISEPTRLGRISYAVF